MIDKIIVTILQTKVGWFIGGVFGAAIAVATVYFVAFALIMIGGSARSIIKILIKDYHLRKAARHTAYDTAWNGAHLGVTMPDGGEPVAEEKKEKEK